MPEAYIVSASRTPIGRFLGGLCAVSAPQLAATAMCAALHKAELTPDCVNEVIFGNVLSAGVGQAPARQAALLAGCPPTVAALTVNKVCGSGLKAVMLADQAIRAGDAEIIVAGGMESMSRAPHLVTDVRRGWKFGNHTAVDSMVHDGLHCATEGVGMGVLAEYTAEKYGVSRAEQDAFAAESHRRACAAMRDGKFAAELVPVTIGRGPGTDRVAGPVARNEVGQTPDATQTKVIRAPDVAVERDESPRVNTTVEALAALAPAFKPGGTVTAGNASQLSDGAAAVIVTHEKIARAISSPVKARIVASVTTGVAPRELFIAPISAIQAVLAKARLTLAEIELVELNEAFAAQCLACIRPLEIDRDKLNVHGGAIALGHPIGASGARVLVTLLHALVDRGLTRGLAVLCLGGGNAVAMIVELVNGRN